MIRLACIALAAAACLFAGLGGYGLYDPHESSYAETALEMRARGDWITPRLAGAPQYDKPPLYYWLAQPMFALLGETELAARLPNALAAAAAALIAGALGARLFSPRAGLAAGLVLATSFGTVVFGRQLMLEELLCATQALSIYGLFRAREAARAGGATQGWCALAGGAGGLAVLAKGLLGLVFPGAVALAMCLLPGEAAARRALLRGAPLAIAALLAVALPWHVAAQLRHDGFLRRYLFEEQILRYLERRPHQDTKPVGLALFFGFAAIWLFPWTPFLPAALARGARTPDERGALRIVGAWAGSVFLFFGATGARLEYYSLPALLPLALVLGNYFADPAPPGAGVAAGALLAAVAAGAVAVPALLERWGQYVPDPRIPGLARGMLASLGAGAAAALVALALGRRRAAFGVLAACTIVCAVLLGRGFAIYAPTRSSEAVAGAVAALARPSDALVLDEPGEWEHVAGLAWYLRPRPDAPRPLVLNADAKRADRMSTPEEAFLLDQADLDRLRASGRRVILVTSRPERWPGARAAARAGARSVLILGEEGGG